MSIISNQQLHESETSCVAVENCCVSTSAITQGYAAHWRVLQYNMSGPTRERN